ncbi:uncharacterized protein LOC119577183 [Penaeus monodon]|uniref:uncharacterized protein LOC119577183 n=1 Tax=Penaeus monodon TaxID=6687 RepID=UPI0018A7DA0A|nr:uncharacterized protein LOC119577183 [Penaeus monodon]
MKLLVWISVVVAGSLAQPEAFSFPRPSSGALEVIKRLGESRAGDIKVTQGRSKAGDSPIFFIKLPPSPYYFRPNSVPSPAHNLEKLPVSFVNNGKPHRVQHWNLPLINAHRSRPLHPHTRLRPHPHLHLRPRPHTPTLPAVTPPSTTQTKMTETQPQLQQPQPQPQLLPTTTTTTTTVAPHPPMAKTRPVKPWVNLKKGFVYNGRPSSVYVWSPVKSAVKTPVKTPVKIFMRRQPSENVYFGRSNDNGNE